MINIDSFELRFSNELNIFVNNDAYDVETRNENFKHDRLIEKKNLRSSKIFINKNHSNFKTMIFFVLYFLNRDHHQRNFDDKKQKTIFKNAQRKFNMTISHFRNDHYWSIWMYLNVKKKRIFQNNAKLIKNAKQKHNIERLTIFDMIKQNVYDRWSIIDENLTSIIFAQLRIDSFYFQIVERKINILINVVDLSTLFLTLTFFEKWVKYRKIFKTIEEKNTISNNRSWKTIQYYHHRWLFLKQHFFRNSKVFEFEHLKNLIKKQKFQNRDAIHTHNLLWIVYIIEKFIAKNYIRVDLFDSMKKSKFHKLISKHQIHICRKNLCKKSLNDDVKICNKSFFAFLSNTTHQMKNDLKYTYKRLKKTNRWIFLYNFVILTIWKTHMNIQYCTFDDLISYVSKYVTKSKSKKLYNFQQNYHVLNQHFITRRMNSMKNMMFFLNFEIFRCSRKMHYLIIVKSKKKSI